MTTENLAQLHFTKPQILGVVTTVGDQEKVFADEADTYGLSEEESTRLSKVVGLERRRVVSGEHTTVDLCEHSARQLLDGLKVSASSVSALILVTQSPDHRAPASAITLQHRLGLPITSMAFDVNLGCSGFVYGLSIAYSLIESGLEQVLLCVGDVASRFVDPSDHSIAPIMGDGGSAILIKKGSSTSYFQLYSDGSGARALMMPNSGARNVAEDEGKPALMHMEGADVFNFTLKRVPSLINSILSFSGVDKDEIDYFIMHQPNRYILKTMQKRLKLPEAKVPMETQAVFGNLNSASIPGTINGFLTKPYQESTTRSVFAGFGIGLSWGACVIDTKDIYAPETFIGVQ